MGMQIFESSGTFNPAQHGLEVGDVLNVVVVGGGASGGFSGYSNSMNPPVTPGLSGGASSFGQYCTASGGGYGNGIGASLGSSGKYIANGAEHWCGAGAGGFYPNVPLSNAATRSAVEYSQIFSTGGVEDVIIAATGKSATTDIITIGGGTSGEYISSSSANVRGERGSLFGIGAGPSTGYVRSGTGRYAGGNGAGYGAGGGAAIYRYDAYSTAPQGGNSGEIKRASITLNSINAIPVTVGLGGAEVCYAGDAKYHSGKGAPGVVIVFW